MIPQWLDIDTQNTAEGIGFFFTSGIKKSNWIKYNSCTTLIKIKSFVLYTLEGLNWKNSELYLCCFKNVSKCPESWKYYWNMVCWQGFIIPTHVIEQNQISICRKKLYSYYRLNEDQITRTMNCCRWYIQNF